MPNSKCQIVFNLALVCLVLFNCGCASIALPEIKPTALCEKQLAPKCSGGSIQIDGKDVETNEELKARLFNQPGSTESFKNFASSRAAVNNLITWTVSLIGGGMAATLGIAVAGITSGSLNNAELTGIGISALAVVAGFLLIPFESLQDAEAKNHLLESIFRYNNSCLCAKNTGDNKATADFYFPQRDFWLVSGVNFNGVCGKDVFSADSEKASSIFGNVSGYKESLSLIQDNELAEKASSYGVLALIAGGIYLQSVFKTSTLFTGAWLTLIPLSFWEISLGDSSMNEAFSILEKKNTAGCCGK